MVQKKLNPKNKKSDAKLLDKGKYFFKSKKIIGSLIVFLFLVPIISIVIWNMLYVKVTFNTDGGNEIKSKYIRKGTQLKETIIAEKFGHNFLSWTYGNTEKVYELDDYINNDITLIAQYEARLENSYVEGKYEDISKDTEIIVHSLVKLTNNNISEYISVKDIVDETIKLEVKSKKNDLYSITAKDGWIEGNTYIIDILSLTQVEFVSLNKKEIGSNIHKITFNIFKEDKYEYEYTKQVKEVDQKNVKSINKKGTTELQDTTLDTYTVRMSDSNNYMIGDVLLLGTDTEDIQDDNYYVVIDNEFGILTVREATLEDVYSELDFFYNNNIDLTKENVDIEAVEQQVKDEILKDEEGLVLLTNMYIKGAYNTKEVIDTLEGYNQEEIDEMMESSKIATIPQDRIDVDIRYVVTDDGEAKVNISVSVKGVEISLGDKGKLTVTFTISEEFTAYINVALEKAENKGFYTYAGVNVDNKFTMTFSIELKTKDGVIDLKDEVENFLTSAAQSDDSKYDWVDEVNNSKIMETTFDYIPILEKQLFKTYIDVGLISIQVKVDGVISVGAEAALYASYSIETYANAGKTNGYIDSDGDAYTNTDGKTKTWSHHGIRNSSFDFALKGAVGIRAGIKLSVNVSVLRMNDLYSIGLSLEAGVYFEFTGFVQVSIDITYSKVKSSLIGGIDLEIGVYIELDFIWNCWPFGMNTTDDYSLYNKNFPLYNFSTLGKVEGFVNGSGAGTEDNPIIVTSNKYNVFNDYPRIGVISATKYNEDTKKYERVNAIPDAYNIYYRCVEHWDSKTEKIYCNPEESINKYTSLIKTGLEAGTIVVDDDAPDGYKFFYTISGFTIDPITGVRNESVTRNVWFQYEKPVDDGIYDITFDLGEGSVALYPNQKQIKFTVGHGGEVQFEQIPQSYTKDGVTYVFDRWSNNFDKSMRFYDGDVVIKAIYKTTVAKYTYTFNASGGKFSNNSDTKSYIVEHSDTIGNVEKPTRLNYSFVGWTTDPMGDTPNVTIKDGFLYNQNNEIIYSDTELFAIWKEMNVSTYTLTFNAVDGWIVDENGSLNHKASYTVKKGEQFWDVPIAIKSPNNALDYYYVDETFGLEAGFIPTKSQTYTANYQKMNRSFDLFISDSTFIKQNGSITYSDDILASVTDANWKSGSFSDNLSLPSASVTIDGQTYTTNKYIMIVENTKQVPYSMKVGASSLKSTYGWNYETINVNFYGHNISAILYTSNSAIDYGTIISYYHNGSELDLKGISYIEATVVPYFEIS